MPSLETEQAIEEKMDTIEELLEQHILDAVISVLIKITDRNELFVKQYRPWKCYRTDCDKRDDIPF
jgi:methionyl-tRNA synthetase